MCFARMQAEWKRVRNDRNSGFDLVDGRGGCRAGVGVGCDRGGRGAEEAEWQISPCRCLFPTSG